MDASQQMRRRPMAPLLTCLEGLGCEITFEDRDGFFPFTLKGNGFSQNEITVDIGSSSQFLSALLISACMAEHDMTIRIKGTHGMAYIKMTEIMMEQFGVTVLHPSKNCFVIPKGPGRMKSNLTYRQHAIFMQWLRFSMFRFLCAEYTYLPCRAILLFFVSSKRWDAH